MQGFRNAADAQKLAHAKKMDKNKKFADITSKTLIFFHL